MFASIRSWLAGQTRAPAPELPAISRDDIVHLWHRPDGLPKVDWELADHWIQRRAGAVAPEIWRRTVMAACLDEVRDALKEDHRRWRSRNVEGLAPLHGLVGPAVAAVSEKAYRELQRDLRVVRGDDPIPPVAIVAIEPQESYIDFTSSYFPDDGRFATSGGLYLNDGPTTFPLIVISSTARHGCEQGVVHELTHHALYGSNLPAWIEEGFTQMMEERVVGIPNFVLNAEMISRQRGRWNASNLDEFIDGQGFLCADEDTQELAYHLSQWVVRGELTRRPSAFFEFVRTCRHSEPEDACQQVLGLSMLELVTQTLGLDD